jgi:CheY-like chemotaxis protein
MRGERPARVESLWREGDIRHDSCKSICGSYVVALFLFGDALREKGLHVLSAANGLEALELYRENADKVWLVVTDVIMPGMDGLTAAVEMQKIDKNVFFLFMSGHVLVQLSCIY